MTMAKAFEWNGRCCLDRRLQHVGHVGPNAKNSKQIYPIAGHVRLVENKFYSDITPRKMLL